MHVGFNRETTVLIIPFLFAMLVYGSDQVLVGYTIQESRLISHDDLVEVQVP